MDDAVMVEVLRNQFMGVARELGYVVRNAAHSVFVKETADFGAYLVSRAGEVFMTPDDMGIFITIGTPMGGAIAAIDHYEEGDICITNDPEGSGGMVTHLPDVFMWTPIFAPGRADPLCFAFCFLHATDVGGLIAGSVSPVATDMFQEGLIMPPTKLARAGVSQSRDRQYPHGQHPDAGAQLGRLPSADGPGSTSAGSGWTT